MSRSLNKVHLIGNVGSDPEIRATSGGARVAKVPLATNRSWTDKAGAKLFHASSYMNAEADEVARKIAEKEGAWIRSLAWCPCRRPVLDRTYMGHRSCRLCGRLLRGSERR